MELSSSSKDLEVSSSLKEYYVYEMVGESRVLSGFIPTHADFFYRNAFLIIKLSNPPSFRAIRAPIASQSTFVINCCLSTFFLFLFLYVILHEFCSVLI